MSNREQAINIINSFDDTQVDQILSMLQAIKALTDEREDDLFCLKLYDDYRKDSDPHKDDAVPLSDFAKQLGIELS